MVGWWACVIGYSWASLRKQDRGKVHLGEVIKGNWTDLFTYLGECMESIVL